LFCFQLNSAYNQATFFQDLTKGRLVRAAVKRISVGIGQHARLDRVAIVGRAIQLDRAEKRITNRLERISDIAEMVEVFCEAHRCRKQTVAEINIALDEILSNIINYGYDDEGIGEIAIRLYFKSDSIFVEVEDAAKPFDPTQARPPQFAESLHARKVGGLGIHFVKTLMDEVVYTRHQGKNMLKLKKKLDSL